MTVKKRETITGLRVTIFMGFSYNDRGAGYIKSVVDRTIADIKYIKRK